MRIKIAILELAALLLMGSCIADAVQDKEARTAADLDSIELDENGAIKDVDGLKKSAKDEWSDFIVSEGQKGAQTPTPPSNIGGNKMTKEQIMNIKDAETRQQAMLDNREAFGI